MKKTIIILFLLCDLFFTTLLYGALDSKTKLDSFRAYRDNVDLWNGKITFTTLVNNVEKPNTMAYRENGKIKFRPMTDREEQDLLTALYKAHTGIIECVYKKLPEKYKKLMKKNEKRKKFRFVFQNIGSRHANIRKHDLFTFQEKVDGRMVIVIEVNIQYLYNYDKDANSPYNYTRFIGGYNSSLSQTLGHELMHQLFNMTDGSGKTECESWCLEKMCFDESMPIGKVDDQIINFRAGGTQEVQRECAGELCQDDFCKDLDNIDCDKRKKPTKIVLARNNTPDDNYSYFTGADLSSNDVMPSQIVGDFSSFNFYPDVLVYNKYEYTEITQLLDKYKLDFISDYSHDYFDNNHKVLVIPSGEWMGEEQSEITREAIRQFVDQGGTIIVLSQQYDEHIQGLVPIPEGETLTAYGWRQDQSCYNGSVYFNGMHPVLSSATNQLLSAAVDGYFETWPQNSTVLLNRTKNREAAMLYYPYGEGHVILTSFNTDCGALYLTIKKELSC